MILLSDEKELKDSWYEIINKDNNPNGLSHIDIQTIIDFITIDPIQTAGYMFTMNYQIPWFIVDAVYTDLSNISKPFAPPIHKIAYLFCDSLNQTFLNKMYGGGIVAEDGFKHLLHIYHWSRAPDGMYVVDRSITRWIGQFYIPSATELQLSRTFFEKAEGATTDVSYGDGRMYVLMQIAPWYLDNYSSKFYESLLRFEDLYGFRCGLLFSSYVTCMANLLKTEADVRVLREKDIIPGTSFDDKAVLDCVQELKTLIDDSVFLPNELAILEEKVMAHHKKSVYRVIGEFKKRYCSNTWVIISVIAGISLFVLTFIQTVLSFIQTKYSMLSYKQQ